MSDLLSLFLFVVLLFNCCLDSIAARSGSGSSSKASATRKIAAITQKLPMVPLSDRNFTTYITERPRNYYAFVLFTATAPQFQCAICKRSKLKFQEVSQYYNDQYDFGSEKISPKDRLAFFVVEVDSAREVFNNMQLETVPRMYLLPPTEADTARMKISEYEVPSSVLLDGIPSTLQQIEDSTGIKIQVQLDPIPVLMALALVSVLTALIISVAQRDILSAIFWYQNPGLWVIVSAICFGVGVSGSIYCVIRSSPPFGLARGGGLVLFSQGGRDQFFVEGLIVALWTLGCGIASYFMSFALRIKFPVLRHLAVILAMSIWVVLAVELFNTYRTKTPWYNIKDTLPPEMWAWMSASVKKSTGLLKRLYRVSEFWLSNDKGWEAFSKKFKALVVDYVKRSVGVSTSV